jgi:hypothetical protein
MFRGRLYTLVATEAAPGDRQSRKIQVMVLFIVVWVIPLLLASVWLVWYYTHSANMMALLYAARAARDNTDLSLRLCPGGGRKTVLYGVFSTADKVLFRNTTRQQVQCGFNSNNHSTVFVVGAPRTPRENDTMRAEAALYGDVFTLTCQENMNEGKSYTYFKEALQQLPCFDFYAKVDDDAVFSPNRLSAALRSMPNDTALIIGRRLSMEDCYNWRQLVSDWFHYGCRDMSFHLIHHFAAGMLYVLNARAVKGWTELNPLATQLFGDEDVRTSYYMERVGARAIDMHTTFHDPRTTFHADICPNITNASLAAHPYKAPKLLADAFAAICA